MQCHVKSLRLNARPQSTSHVKRRIYPAMLVMRSMCTIFCEEVLPDDIYRVSITVLIRHFMCVLLEASTYNFNGLSGV